MTTPANTQPDRVAFFAFAITDGKTPTTRDKRRRELVAYVDGWIEGVDIVDEWSEDLTRWLVVSVPAAVSGRMARDFAESAPYYVRESFCVVDPVRKAGETVAFVPVVTA